MMCESSVVLADVAALWCVPARAKFQANTAAGKPNYRALLDRARLEVSNEARAQIDADIPRTFVSLPVELRPRREDSTASQAALKRILLASEWRTSNGQTEGSGGSAYTQGMNALAAMCFAGVGWQEELAFWLFIVLLEDVLSLGFFAEWPPLHSYHALNAVAGQLLGYACPALGAELGDEVEDVATMLSVRLFCTCFVYCIPAGPLVALWSELLCDDGEFPRRPLLYWFFGLLQYFETDLVRALRESEDGDLIGGKTAVIFPTALWLMDELAPDWRPSANVKCPLGSELKELVEAQEVRLLHEAQKLHFGCCIERSLVDTLHREFLVLLQKGDDGISFDILLAVLRRFTPDQKAKRSATQLFRLLDRENTGALDFFELMTGILVLCEGSRDGKLRLLFDLYDTDRSGYLDRDELVPLSNALLKLVSDSSEGCRYQEDALPNRSPCCGTQPDPARPLSSARTFSLCDHDSSPRPVPTRRSLSSARFEEGCRTAEQLRRRLLLLNRNVEGRLSFEDFRLGISADAMLASCFAQITTETSSQGLPSHLFFSIDRLPSLDYPRSRCCTGCTRIPRRRDGCVAM